MSLPMDFSTALWWRSVPLWEWEVLPPPAPDATAPEGGTTASTADGAASASASAPAPAPPPQPGSERDGYRLVFKGYQVSASLFWYPSDSALSRPWLRHDEPAADRRPRTDETADAAARAALLQRAADGTEGGPA